MLTNLLLTPFAFADEDCSAGEPDPNDPHTMIVEWHLGSRETDAPDIEIYAPAYGELTIEVTYGLGIDGEVVEWYSEVWNPEPLDVIVAPVEIPFDAYWVIDQSVRLSSLTVRVSAWIGSTLTSVVSIEPLRVAFPYGAEEPVFLDARLMEALAPGGVLLDYSDEGSQEEWESIEYLAIPEQDPERTVARAEVEEEH